MELIKNENGYFIKIDDRIRDVNFAFNKTDIEDFRAQMEITFALDNWYNQQSLSDEVIKDFIDKKATPEYLKKHAAEAISEIVSEAVDVAKSERIEAMNRLKMYILVRSDIGLGHQVNCVAHAAASAILTWENDETFENWKKHSFRKVTCSVTRGQFEEAKQYSDNLIISEDVLNDTEVAMAFKPREDWPEFFKKLRLLG